MPVTFNKSHIGGTAAESVETINGKSYQLITSKWVSGGISCIAIPVKIEGNDIVFLSYSGKKELVKAPKGTRATKNNIAENHQLGIEQLKEMVESETVETLKS